VTEAERRAGLEAIASEVRGCTRCRLSETRTQAVPGEGHPSTEVLFGAAGQFLEELLGSVGWSRDEVFITNVVKCRPPQNRDPEPEEIAACAPYLRRQLEVLDPSLVVTLGRHSMGRFMPGARIGQVHGTFRPVPEELGAPDALVFAMYHPAAALHQASLRQTLLDDMTQVPAALVEARRRRGAGPGEGTVAEVAGDPARAKPARAEPGTAGPSVVSEMAGAPIVLDPDSPPSAGDAIVHAGAGDVTASTDTEAPTAGADTEAPTAGADTAAPGAAQAPEADTVGAATAGADPEPLDPAAVALDVGETSPGPTLATVAADTSGDPPSTEGMVLVAAPVDADRMPEDQMTLFQS
jgi:uracil-DNA glycosylase family 4